jgi:hypothetical protein
MAGDKFLDSFVGKPGDPNTSEDFVDLAEIGDYGFL